jgi:hypothetical protein
MRNHLTSHLLFGLGHLMVVTLKPDVYLLNVFVKLLSKVVTFILMGETLLERFLLIHNHDSSVG